MKKILTAVAAIMMISAACFDADARGLIVKGGFSYSHFDLTQSIKDQAKAISLEPMNYSGFHAAIGYQTESFSGFTFQPEVMFLSRKGNKFGDKDFWAKKYIEVPVNIQWGIDLVALRPFLQLSPYLGYSIGDVRTPNNEKNLMIERMAIGSNNFEYGLGVGGGIELMRRLQLSAQYVWNFGQVANLSQFVSDATSIGRDTAAALEISLALMF